VPNNQTQNELRQLGLRVTGPRIRILELFLREHKEKGPHHLTAEDIHHTLIKEGIDVGLATVYRVLTQFEDAGLIVRRELGNVIATYELDTGEHHDHIVCVKCGRIEEFVDSEIEKRQREIAKRLGYELQGHSLSLYGLCKTCRAQQANRGHNPTKHSA